MNALGDAWSRHPVLLTVVPAVMVLFLLAVFLVMLNEIIDYVRNP